MSEIDFVSNLRLCIAESVFLRMILNEAELRQAPRHGARGQDLLCPNITQAIAAVQILLRAIMSNICRTARWIISIRYFLSPPPVDNFHDQILKSNDVFYI